MTVFTTPVNYTMPVTEDGSQWEPVWETYDFIQRDNNGQVQHDGLWAGAFPLPVAMGGGRSSMHAYFHRYDRYADLPETIRAFVDEHATMWQEPPRDLDEIRAPAEITIVEISGKYSQLQILTIATAALLLDLLLSC